jgi:hypothetical protein
MALFLLPPQTLSHAMRLIDLFPVLGARRATVAARPHAPLCSTPLGSVPLPTSKGMAMKTVERGLWEIFSNYTLRNNPWDPFRISVRRLTNL